jgi:hypothetical protein
LKEKLASIEKEKFEIAKHAAIAKEESKEKKSQMRAELKAAAAKRG